MVQPSLIAEGKGLVIYAVSCVILFSRLVLLYKRLFFQQDHNTDSNHLWKLDVHGEKEKYVIIINKESGKALSNQG
jgi:hypothetical protein